MSRHRSTDKEGRGGLRSALSAVLWAVLVLGGMIFFFWIIWDPPR